MFRASNDVEITPEDRTLQLSKQAQKAVDMSKAKLVGDIVYPNIDEQKFTSLYSEVGSRPNIPIRKYVSALVLKRMYGLSDEVFLEFLRCGAMNFQYALHTLNEQVQPLSENSLRRFRRKVEAYNEEHSCDLIKEEFQSISRKMAVDMGLLRADPSEGKDEDQAILVRMDSMEIEAHAKAMSRIEILYTTIVIVLRWLLKKGFGSIIPDKLSHYKEDGDKNKVIYHRHKDDKDSSQAETHIEELVEEMQILKELMENNLSVGLLTVIPEYTVFLRVLDEQTIIDSEGKRIPREAKDISPNSVQNPFDTTMTYRYKRGQHHGFVMNVAEVIDGTGNGIVIHVGVEPNTLSDSNMAEQYVAEQPDHGPKQILTADGAYNSEKLNEMAKEKGISICNTSLTGSVPKDVYADFVLDETGLKLLQCPIGKVPESSKCNLRTGMITARMPDNCCYGCPHRDDCNPRFNKKHTMSRVVVSQKMVTRSQQARSFSTEEGKANARRRNGVEGIMSVMRRKYNIDHIPVFGLERVKTWIWTTLLSYNIGKYRNYIIGQKKVFAA